MQLRHINSLIPSCRNIDKVTALAWSPNSRRLAAVSLQRIVSLFDENGELKDKFSTKPADPKGPKDYFIVGMVFSPDSTRLAIAQSDDIIFVYRLGSEWGDKKSICNKFQQTCSIVSIVWPCQHQNEILIGLMDGKVKSGNLRTNKAATIYAHGGGCAVVSLASSPDGSACLVGHIDGSIYRFVFENSSPGISAIKLSNHGSIPLVLAWGKSIVAAGPDCKVAFYDANGAILQQFDYSNIQAAQDFVSVCFNPSGETVVLGCFNGFHVFSLTSQTGFWEDVGWMEIQNIYTVSTLAWKPDGSQLAVGGLCGNVDLFDACLNRHCYEGKFEFTYITKSQVIIKTLASGARIVLRSHQGCEITKINIYHDQYLIAHTPETLLMGNLESCKLSEVPWCGSGNEKFLLDYPSVCMIHNAGEVSLVEYGSNKVLGTFRTEHLSQFLISVRLNDQISTLQTVQDDNKKIAYLMDLQTIRILDLVSGCTSGTLNHDCQIDWLELNPKATYLLFRDQEQQLHLFNVATQDRTSLLSFCSYVQWVPDSDVIVAQNIGNLYVWYSIKNPEQATVFPIKGEVEGIERSQGRTEVIVNEGLNIVSYVLDEALIEFGSALENLDYDRAISILEPLQTTPETEAMWRQLGSTALSFRELAYAERCFAALGDVAKARYIHKVKKIRDTVMQEVRKDGVDHYLVRAKLAILNHQWKVSSLKPRPGAMLHYVCNGIDKALASCEAAEILLLEHGRVAEVLLMYTQCHKWKEAIAVAESQNHPDAGTLRQNHFEWLLQTGQEEEAGKLKESEGDVLGAITLFLKGGLPGHAADCAIINPLPFQTDVVESIALALNRAGMFEKAGNLLEKYGHYDRAKDAYRRGHAYRHAVDLARREFPSEVVPLEEEWGNWLVSQNQVDAAISHFIEAGCSTKAIESAIASRQWTKAAQIVEAQSTQVARPFYERLAQHFEASKQYGEAEKYFIQAKLAGKAVEMYIRANKWEPAQKVAARYLSEREAKEIYLKRATELETLKHYKDAEALYIEASEHDLSISMYKKARAFDDMIRLVAKYRRDHLQETHSFLAQQFASEGSLKDAEHHYLEAQDWRSPVKMYSSNDMWEDSMRVAKLYGGVDGSKQVAYAWAVSLGGENGAQLLAKLGLVEQAIEYAMEAGAFEHAFDLCRSSLKQKLPEVQLKYAMYLEDEGRFRDAEEQFMKVGKPREAIEMYIHQKDWLAAMRVADLCDPAALSEIQVAQAQLLVDKKEYAQAEVLLIKAKRADLAIEMLKENHRWEDAIRVAKLFMPSKVPDIHSEMAACMQRENGGTETVEIVMARATALEHRQSYAEAIDVYLQVDARLVPEIEKLHQIWMMAVKIAKDHAPRSLSQVVDAVAKKLAASGFIKEGAKLYEDIKAHREAADMYIQAENWEKARKLAASSGQQLQKHVEDLWKKHLVEKGQVDQLVKTGHIAEAIDLYVRQDNWEKVHELAGMLGPESEKGLSMRHAKLCLQNAECPEAISILAQYGVPSNGEAYELCCFAAHQLLNSAYVLESSIEELRALLYDVMKVLGEESSAGLESACLELKRLLTVATFMSLRYIARAQGLKDIEAKLSISLLRYVGVIPADRAFYEAGMACKELGWEAMAFLYLNRYLDIAEGIDDQDTGVASNISEFEITDIPQDFPIPEKHFVEDVKTEDVRDWVIQMSMDQNVDHIFTRRKCGICKEEICASALLCRFCKVQSEACCVTGYPVLEDDRITCHDCKMHANKSDWNKFVHKCQICPWCKGLQQPVY